jgi:hypothetical protein
MSDCNSEVPARSPGLSLRQTQMALLGILVAGLAWRLYGVIDRSLWYDEAKIYFVSRFPLAELFNRLHYDADAPLFYLLLKAWTLVGASPFTLRLPSVFFGVLAILGAYLFTVESLRIPSRPEGTRPPPPSRARETGLWAAALVAFSVFQIRWSWEINRFAVAAALAVWSSWALLRALHAGSGKYGFWLLYTVLALAFGWTDYLGLLTIAAQWLFFAAYLVLEVRTAGKALPVSRQQSGSFLRRLIRHPQFELAVRSAFVLGLAFVAWLHFFRGQLEQVEMASWMPPPSWSTAGGYTYHVMIDPEGYPPREAVSLVMLCSVFCVAVPVMLLWKPAAPQWFVLLVMVLPFGLCLAAASWFDLPIFFSRYSCSWALLC